jgi:hypothetical protein
MEGRSASREAELRALDASASLSRARIATIRSCHARGGSHTTCSRIRVGRTRCRRCPSLIPYLGRAEIRVEELDAAGRGIAVKSWEFIRYERPQGARTP